MGNRSRYAAFGWAALGLAGGRALVRARRRARLGRAAQGFVDSVMPSVGAVRSPAPATAGDEAHAPGHQHLAPTAEEIEEAAPAVVRFRPFAKHRHGLRHPGRG